MRLALAWSAALLSGAALAVSTPLAGQGGRSPEAPEARTLRFVVIGDYGSGNLAEAAVAQLVHSLEPQFILTAGDNNYPDGEAATIDTNVGQFYADWIHPYTGAYGNGAKHNRFWPTLGNHDWRTAGAIPYLDYFTLPGNERYYDFRIGAVHFFAIDSASDEPDGNSADSVQGNWLRTRLARSTAPFQIVYFHHTPFSSSSHGAYRPMQWPFQEWGADAVIAGHDHVYERLHLDGLPFFVSGLGGKAKYAIEQRVAGSERAYAQTYGALLVEGDHRRLRFRFLSVFGAVVDEFVLDAPGWVRPQEPLVPFRAEWLYKDDGVEPAEDWITLGFDDSSWKRGESELGYGDDDEATVIDFGGNPSAKHITTWFRRSFDVADPESLRRLSLQVLRDDGLVAYLNGVEVMRENLPGGPILPDTLALEEIRIGHEDSFYAASIDPRWLRVGENVLAVEVHQFDPADPDLSFHARLVAESGGEELVATGSEWRFLDDGVDPGAAWAEPGFDDAAWALGRAQLGYGDGDETTVVGYGGNPALKHPTTWFRRAFTVTGTPDYEILELELLRDDGAAVYLNGVEVLRSNLPDSGFTSSTYALDVTDGFDESQLSRTRIDRSLLVTGRNVIAVEVHQHDPASDDLSFDLALRAW